MTWTKPKQLTRAKAQECLAAVNEQFREYIDPAGGPSDKPTLYEPGFHADSWTIAWEGGPFEWTMLAFTGGFDQEMFHLALDAARESGQAGEQAKATAREMATKPAHPRPEGVFVEPLNHWALCLYPED